MRQQGRREPRLIILLVFYWFAVLLGADLTPVVINEVLYDPSDADSGYEWIELYNAGDTDVNLEGWRILKGGSSYEKVFEFPSFVLRSGRYVLVGEQYVQAAMFTAPLGFQNGGNLSDGIRIESQDGEFTDTLLYDEPNTYALIDDSGEPGTSFAPDTPEGKSLARRKNGEDSNLCSLDFIVESDPTPGLENPLYVDYALLHPQISGINGYWQLIFYVKNLSEFEPENAAQVTAYIDATQFASEAVASVEPGDSLQLTFNITVFDQLNHAVTVSLDLSDDPVTDNNMLTLSLFEENPQLPVISEVMYDPGPGKQEWIEIFLEDNSWPTDYRMVDATGNELVFSLPSAAGYYVVCTSAEDLKADYPDCPQNSIIEVNDWFFFNNEGDTITLRTWNNVRVDEMSYIGVNYQQGRSLERYLDSSLNPQWRYSLDGSGATPGRENSSTPPVPEFEGRLKLEGSPCKAREGESISIFYSLDDEQSRANCRIFDRAGHRIRILADDLLLGNEGSLSWDGKDQSGKYVPRGLYFLVWESRSSTGGKTYRRQLSLVIYD